MDPATTMTGGVVGQHVPLAAGVDDHGPGDGQAGPYAAGGHLDIMPRLR